MEEKYGKSEKVSLEKLLKGIENTRRKNSVIYPLHEVLLIMLVAVIRGATTYVKNRNVRKQ